MKVELPTDWSDELKNMANGLAGVAFVALIVGSLALTLAVIALAGKRGHHAD